MNQNNGEFMKAKNNTITYLRALAIILVVVHHAFYYQVSNSISPIDLSMSTWGFFQLVVTTIHVPLFFFLAGYLSHEQSIKNYYLKKVTRVLIPFLFLRPLKWYLIFSLLMSMLMVQVWVTSYLEHL